jgi:membrane associated rhomboid family serine protease
MPRLGPTPFAFPDFRGATRRLVLVNLVAYFVLALMQLALPFQGLQMAQAFSFIPSEFLLHGQLWQPLTYSLVHPSLMGTLLELLSLWFLAGFLESAHTEGWILGLYTASVVGTAAAAAAIYLCASTLGFSGQQVPIMGCFGGIFGLLGAIGVLYGDTQFLMFFVIGIKARYLVVVSVLIAIAMLFGQQHLYAFAELGGLLGGLLYLRLAPRRGFSFSFSEQLYALRNRYYRWKRRRAGRKFEVYMRKQGRTVRFDGNGRQIHDDPNDKSRWN